jgi:hypothetical protein
MDINHFLVTESGRITYDIYKRTQFSSPWITLPKKTAWPEGMGEQLTTVMWERPFIRQENEWAPMTLNEAETGSISGTGSCIPPVDLVEFTARTRSTSLYHKAVHSPRFCVTDLLYTAKRESQMQAVEWGLSDQVRLLWIKWNREGFTKLANKYVVEPSMAYTTEEDGLTFPPVPATSMLTNGVLDYFYNLLTVEQGHRHALSMQNSRPIYGLITDQNTSRFLKREDDKIREDFRQSSEADSLLAPLGVTYTYNGFIHMMDEAPPRYNFNDEADEGVDPWVEVDHYMLDETDPRKPRKIVNPEWLAAQYQDSFIFVKDAYQLRVPGSITGVSAAKFDPQRYMGDFRWQNIINVDENSPAYNPDGKMGRFRGVLASGVESIAPHVMYVIRHKSCPGPLGLVNCPTGD